MQAARLLCPALLLAGCVTSPAPRNRPPVAAGAPITFYPDACRDRGGVDGDVRVAGASDLSALAEAPCVTGSVVIEATGLDAIRLERLAEVGGDLLIRDNGALTRIELPQLRLVGGALGILNLPKLETLALPELQAVGDHLLVGRHADLDAGLSPTTAGSALSEVDLPALRAVGGALVFRTNPRLTGFAAPALARIGDGLLVEGAPALTGFALAPTAEIARTLTLIGTGLEDLAALKGRSVVQGELRIVDNARLARLDGADALAEIGGDLHLATNPRLASVEIPTLRTVGGALVLWSHPRLERVRLTGLVSVGGRVEISGQPALAGVKLTVLRRVGGNLDFAANFALTDVDLLGLTHVEGDLGVVDNPALEGFAAPALLGVKDNLVVKGNATLAGVSLPALTEISGYVTIQDNLALTSLQGLAALKRVGVKLFVRDNPKLPTCGVHQLRDRLDPRPMWGEDIGGNDDAAACE